MSGARVLINILSLFRKDLEVDQTALPYSEPKFVRRPVSSGTGLGTTSFGTSYSAGTSTSGTVTVDTQCSVTSSSGGATLSQGIVTMSLGVIEEVVHMGSDDAEKGHDHSG